MPRLYTLAAGFAALGLNLLVVGPGALRLAASGTVGDFPAFYVASRLVRTNDQYNVEKILQLQETVIGERRPKLLSMRLPFYYWFLSPLGALPYVFAYRAWIAIVWLSAILAVLCYPVPDRFTLVVATLASLPLLQSFLVAQDVSVALLVVACGLALRMRGARFAAGLVFSLLAIKFHLFLLVPVVFLLRREARLVAGLTAGVAALAGLSFAVGGSTWPQDYWRIISNPVASPGPYVMPNLAAVDYFLGGSGFLEWALAGIVVAAVAIVAIASEFELAFAAALIGSLLISHHSYVQDAAVLIPALLVVRSHGGIAATGALICLTPLPYFLAIYGNLGIVPAILFAALLISLGVTKLGARYSAVANPSEQPDGRIPGG
jgi:hypothetical protein